jgi:toxin FitB
MKSCCTATGICWLTDGYIAAIAAANGFAVTTRDISPFEAAGVTVVNPWAV